MKEKGYKMKPTYAILTGDIIGSRKLSAKDLEAVFGHVRELWQTFGQHHGGAVVGTLEVFRGDGWQAALKEPALAVEAAVFLRATFRAQESDIRVDSRIGIGVGRVEHLEADRLRESNGEAFQRSGGILEKLEKKHLGWGIDPGDSQKHVSVSRTMLPLLDLLVRRWSRAEAVAVLGTLLGWTQDEIAAHPLARKKDGQQPTRQAIHDALKRIGWASHLEPVLEEARRQLQEMGRS
jgi:hypothetical protein